MELIQDYQDAKHIFTQEGWISSEKNREYFFNIGKEIKLGLEIGTFKGLSACIIGYHLKAISGAKYFCIDTFESSGNNQQPENTFPAWYDNIVAAQLENVCIPLQGWSHDPDVYARVPYGLDFIFVDGDHDTEPVLRDAKMYWPKLERYGQMAFHDSTWESVRTAINTFMAETPTANIIIDVDDFCVLEKK